MLVTEIGIVLLGGASLVYFYRIFNPSFEYTRLIGEYNLFRAKQKMAKRGFKESEKAKFDDVDLIDNYWRNSK